MKKFDSLSIVILIAFVVFDFYLWQQILFAKPTDEPELYFLDVGQGDSTFLVLPGNVKILTDAGPDRKISRSLAKVLPSSDRYIDLAIISHPQLDHFNGFNDLLERYRFGAFIVNGRNDSPGVEEWPALIEQIKSKKIPLITMEAGDKIRYRDSETEILSPDGEWIQSGELNDTGLVELVKTPRWRALLTADIGTNVEENLVSRYDLRADILKVGHHGSRFSSGEKFLKEVSPRFAVVEAGARNRYGHPTEEALARLRNSGARIFRTDRNGTVKIIGERGKLKVFAEK